MRVMWAVAAVMGKCGAAFGVTQLGSGGWIDACAAHLKPVRDAGELELHIVALSNRDDHCYDEQDRIHYHLLGNPQNRGHVAPDKQVQKWKTCIAQIKPDVIQIWGTEYSIGLDIQKMAGDIPVVFFIQGIMGSLTEHPNGDMKWRELLRGADWMLVPKLLKVLFENRRIRDQVALERKMVCQSQGVIVDSQWAKSQYSYAGVNTYMIPLPINACFSQKQWNHRDCNAHTIFTVAGRTPLKGLHVLVKAVAQVKEHFPDVQLEIPGNADSRKPHLLFEPIYLRYLKKLIAQHGLSENIRFLGKLTQQQMAEHMRKANVFAMPSCIENHSSTLREAMSVGCPCVTADVGSVIEFVKHGENALLYRYNEHATMACYIERIFADKQLAEALGAQAKQTIRKQYPQQTIGDELMRTYVNILKAKEMP